MRNIFVSSPFLMGLIVFFLLYIAALVTSAIFLEDLKPLRPQGHLPKRTDCQLLRFSAPRWPSVDSNRGSRLSSPSLTQISDKACLHSASIPSRAFLSIRTPPIE
jgi:hypothetical protein